MTWKATSKINMVPRHSLASDIRVRDVTRVTPQSKSIGVMFEVKLILPCVGN